MEPVYNSRPLRHPSRLLLRSGQPDIVAISSSQLYHSASRTSLQQPTSKTSQQSATEFGANRTLSQPLSVNSIIPPVEPVYNSQPLRHSSRLLLRSGQLVVVAASSSQLHHSASGTSLQQPTSKTSRQTATQIRPKHCRSLFQSTLLFCQWNQSTAAYFYHITEDYHSIPANRTLSQPLPVNSIVPTVEPAYNS